ncbi:ketosteroid isomerase [Intrasporangium oryzae NRRL B-24470]|uniref:Ketosteroid isomerase n=1 Tax=Intrasporangium oryzae NRRL B-24470 TaxID=1386089 RepID=W9G7H9_9MICO|nr:nuclear transport factor 2 family protein [Intrasporangium oryzae]EWT02131.1 ketosteroid isomerase [Intrasporangium oryzae NRRL B-24470]
MSTTDPGVTAPELLTERFATFAAKADLDGILSLYAVDAVVSLPRGREAAGHAAIRAAYEAAFDAGVDLGAAAPDDGGDVRVMVAGDLAMTSATDADGRVRTQVARRGPDGTWLWVRDGSRLRDVEACLPTTRGRVAALDPGLLIRAATDVA